MAIDVTPANGELDNFAVPPHSDAPSGVTPDMQATMPGELRLIRRNGKVTGFDANKIAVAMTKAFLAVEGGSAAASIVLFLLVLLGGSVGIAWRHHRLGIGDGRGAGRRPRAATGC